MRGQDGVPPPTSLPAAGSAGLNYLFNSTRMLPPSCEEPGVDDNPFYYQNAFTTLERSQGLERGQGYSFFSFMIQFR
jgi:hypothetical protein